jgi:hypothetical protein
MARNSEILPKILNNMKNEKKKHSRNRIMARKLKKVENETHTL